MDRVSAANYVTVGGRRTFADLNLGTNTPGTGLGATWHAGIQESIVRTIEKSGQAPTDFAPAADDLQLYKAIRAIAAGGVTTITANATLTQIGAGLILVSAAAGNVTLTLPPSATGDDYLTEFRILRTDVSANSVMLALSGGDTWITGGSASISVPYGTPAPVVNDGVSKWAYLGNQMRGTLLTLTGTQSLANNTETAVTWPTPLYDQIGGWSGVHATRLTVPPGVNYVGLNAQVTFDASSTGARKMRVVKNGTTEGAGIPALRLGTPDAADVSILGGSSAAYPVIAGDYFELLALQNSGGALNLSPASGNWFSMRVLG